MKLATTFLSSPFLIRSLGWAPRGRINGACAPSFVLVRSYSMKHILKSHAEAGRVKMGEILYHLNKPNKSIPWYDANQILNKHAKGWCGEVRDVKYDNDRVTVVYRVTIIGSDGQAHREGIGTIALNDGRYEEPEAEAEKIAFAKACARFGLGLHCSNEKNTE